MNAFLKFHLICGVISLACELLCLAYLDYPYTLKTTRGGAVILLVWTIIGTAWAAWLYFGLGGAS